MEYGPGSRGALIKASSKVTKPVKSTDLSRATSGCLAYVLITAIGLLIAAAPVILGMLH